MDSEKFAFNGGRAVQSDTFFFSLHFCIGDGFSRV